MEKRKECKRNVMSKLMKGRIRWYRHVERINEDMSVRRTYDTNENFRSSRVRSRKTLHDQVN